MRRMQSIRIHGMIASNDNREERSLCIPGLILDAAVLEGGGDFRQLVDAVRRSNRSDLRLLRILEAEDADRRLMAILPQCVLPRLGPVSD